jgi:hypothetical protein
MTDLIDRLEKATGPDRDIDGAIALSLGWTLQKMKGDQHAYFRKPGVTDYFIRDVPPPYTASVDAAISLVPEGLGWYVRRNVSADGDVIYCNAQVFPFSDPRDDDAPVYWANSDEKPAVP